MTFLSGFVCGLAAAVAAVVVTDVWINTAVTWGEADA